MAKFTRIEEIECWKEGVDLTLKIYGLKRKSSLLLKDYGLVDQMQRASVSMPSNISEGYERHTYQEFIHFLYIAKGSCGELRTQLLIAKELQYIIKDDFELLDDKCRKISSMIMNLIKSLRTFKH
jgi:four helix bundle protein